MDLGDMLKGFAAELTGTVSKDAGTIAKYATKSANDSAGKWLGFFTSVFTGSKYGKGVEQWYTHSGVARSLRNIASQVAKTENLDDVIKGTKFEGWTKENLESVFKKAGDLASSEASGGRDLFLSRFTNKYGNVSPWSLTRASARFAIPVVAVTAPWKIAGGVQSTLGAITPHSPNAAGQVAGQQW